MNHLAPWKPLEGEEGEIRASILFHKNGRDSKLSRNTFPEITVAFEFEKFKEKSHKIK